MRDLPKFGLILLCLVPLSLAYVSWASGTLPSSTERPIPLRDPPADPAENEPTAQNEPAGTDDEPAPAPEAAAPDVTGTAPATETAAEAGETAEESPPATPAGTESPPAAASEETPAEEAPRSPPALDAEPAQTADDQPAQATEAESPAAPSSQPPPPRELTPAAQKLRDEIRRCLAYYLARPENNVERSPWGVMHAIVGFGADTPLLVGQRQVNAIGWLCWNQPCYNMKLFHVEDGQLKVRHGPGYEGHEGQFLQMMAWSRVPQDYVLKVDGYEFTIADLVKYEQLTCRANSELTFKLIGLVHYLGTEASWENQAGESWNIERLIREELPQKINGAACGGTHRLSGLGWAVRKRLQRGEPLTGQWARAQKYVEDYWAYTYRLQNPDGSFSTEWFERPASAPDLERRLNTTGHMLEWLLVSLPDERLEDPQLVKAVTYLKDLMWNQRGHKWYIGSKGHALHSLVLYDERVFGGRPGGRQVELAQLMEASRSMEPPPLREPRTTNTTRRTAPPRRW